jgi:hypothetical protein
VLQLFYDIDPWIDINTFDAYAASLREDAAGVFGSGTHTLQVLWTGRVGVVFQESLQPIPYQVEAWSAGHIKHAPYFNACFKASTCCCQPDVLCF